MKPESMTILTVDDTPANIRLLTHHLQKQGYNVITAEDGFEGFKAAITHQPDLILLDIMMPGTDGYEVCELLKTEEQTRHIPVMFLTAKTDVEARVKGFELGAVDFITKPFNLVEISTRVQNQLEMKNHQQQNERLKNILFHLHPMLPLKQCGGDLIGKLKDGKHSPDISLAVEGWFSMADSFSIESESINVEILIDDVMAIMQKGVIGLAGFHADIKGTTERAEGFPGLLHMALLNAFMNAYEAMNSKGLIHVTKTVGPLPAHLAKSIEANHSEAFHIIDIKDKGIADGRAVFNRENPYEIKDVDFKEFTLRLAAIYEIMGIHNGTMDITTPAKDEFHTVLYIPVS